MAPSLPVGDQGANRQNQPQVRVPGTRCPPAPVQPRRQIPRLRRPGAPHLRGRTHLHELPAAAPGEPVTPKMRRRCQESPAGSVLRAGRRRGWGGTGAYSVPPHQSMPQPVGMVTQPLPLPSGSSLERAGHFPWQNARRRAARGTARAEHSPWSGRVTGRLRTTSGPGHSPVGERTAGRRRHETAPAGWRPFPRRFRGNQYQGGASSAGVPGGDAFRSTKLRLIPGQSGQSLVTVLKLIHRFSGYFR